jgi:hypothetical protein
MNHRLKISLGAAAITLAACGPGAPSSDALQAQAVQLSQQINVSASVILANTNPGTGHITICHYPPGNPGNRHTITVGAPAVPAHIRNHGDTIGPCGAVDGGSGTPTGGDGVDAGSGSPPPPPPPDQDAGTGSGSSQDAGIPIPT